MKYWVDFSCWVVEGKDETDVFAKVRETIEENVKIGLFPTISAIEEVASDDTVDEYLELE